MPVETPNVKITKSVLALTRIVTGQTINSIQPAQRHYHVRLKLHPRNKQHRMRVPLSDQAKKE
ncbi:hypothetical protein JMUB7504_27170 [Staphylococcus aureus]